MSIECPSLIESPTEPRPAAPRDDRWSDPVRGLCVLALAAGFVLWGGASLQLGPDDAKLGLASGSGIGPFGQVFGGWEPSLWPLPVALGRLWTMVSGGIPAVGSVRWPMAIAGVLAGLMLTRRARWVLGTRPSVLTALCWFGSIALIDRSAGTGLDLILGCATIAALDRIINRGTDLIAGFWASLAFLAGGWPPLAVLVLATIVIGRRESALSFALIAPPILTAAAWSAWALNSAQAEAWAASLTLPLTETPQWLFAVGVLLLGLPWSPLALLAASRSVRDGWSGDSRRLVVGWLQVAAMCLVVGTIIPGLAKAALVPALAGLSIVSAASAARVIQGDVARPARWGLLGGSALLVTVWVVVVIIGGIFLASAVPYYRGLSIVLIAAAIGTGFLGLGALIRSQPRRGVLALTAVALTLKLAHWGYYVPEWNYRRGQGPWGRAIGQWVVPNWPIYTFHTWPADLALATGHPVRQLRQPKSLIFQKDTTPSFVLLLGPEFDHWPADAPPLVEVARFQDEHGSPRVLARTAGPFSWNAVARSRRAEEERAR